MEPHITVFWDNIERNTIRWECNGDWVWEDFYNAIGETHSLVQDANPRARLYLIINLESSGPVPSSALAYVRPALPLLIFCQSVIIVRPSGFVRSLISILQNMNPDYQKKIVLVDTLENALTYSKQR